MCVYTLWSIISLKQILRSGITASAPSEFLGAVSPGFLLSIPTQVSWNNYNLENIQQNNMEHKEILF